MGRNRKTGYARKSLRVGIRLGEKEQMMLTDIMIKGHWSRSEAIRKCIEIVYKSMNGIR